MLLLPLFHFVDLVVNKHRPRCDAQIVIVLLAVASSSSSPIPHSQPTQAVSLPTTAVVSNTIQRSIAVSADMGSNISTVY